MLKVERKTCRFSNPLFCFHGIARGSYVRVIQTRAPAWLMIGRKTDQTESKQAHMHALAQSAPDRLKKQADRKECNLTTGSFDFIVKYS